MYIDGNQVQKIFSNRNWAVAMNYHKKGIMDTLDITYHPAQHAYAAYAHTDTFGYYNDVELILLEDGSIAHFSCSCPYCDGKDACGHVGALLLFLNELHPVDFPYHYEKRIEQEKALKEWVHEQQLTKSRAFLASYKRMSEGAFLANLMTDKISIMAELADTTQGLTLSFKLGIEKPYVMKNIINFLNAIRQKEKIKYGKKLEFVHHMDAFDDTSQGLIHFLMRYEKAHISELTYGYYDKRNLLLDSSCMDDFYDFFSDEGKNAINCQFAEDVINTIPLHIRKDGEDYVLTSPLSFDTLYKGENNWYQFCNNTFQRFDHGIFSECSFLIEQLESAHQILLQKEDMQDFCAYVVDKMKDYIALEGDSISAFLEESLHFSCYIDMEDTGDISIRATGYKENGTSYHLLQEERLSGLLADRLYTVINTYQDHMDLQVHAAYISSEERQLAFLTKGLPCLHTLCEVFVSDAIQQLSSPKSVHFQIGIHMQNNLLQIDVHSIDIPADELYAVLKSYRKKKKYHRLKNGEMILLQQETLDEVNTLTEDLHLQAQDLDGGTIQLPSYHSFEVHDIMQQSEHLQIQRSKTFEKALQNMQTMTTKQHPLPEGYAQILRDYQVRGYQWIKTMSGYGFGGILADDMGLGKTVQMIAVLEDEKQQHPEAISIIITPASLLFNWQDEIKKFSANLDCFCIHGSAAERTLAIKELAQHDVIVTSYDYLRRDIAEYAAYHFAYIVLDEAQYIKNHTTKNAAAVKQLSGDHRFALTGTPIENSLAELWSIFDFLMPGYLYNYHYFRKTYEREIVKYENEETSKKLKRLVEPFILRRIKQDVLLELPDKIEQVQTIEFEEEEEKLYLVNLVQINKELQMKLHMETFDKFQILAMMTRLRQLCCDPRLLYENINGPSSKLKGCMDILMNAKANHKKVLLFSSFTSMLEMIEDELTKYQLTYVKLTGETSKEKRRAYVQEFQESAVDVFLISLKAGGTGLNLTAAEVVIHYDPWWNMSAQNQATDRAYRIGQTKNVQVYKLIMKDSIEEKIVRLQEKKINLSNTFTGNSEGSMLTMDKEEILSLFQ